MNGQLRWIAETLEAHDVRFWIDSGTLLGVVRESDVMDHDKDIDLGIWADDLRRLLRLRRVFRVAGYRVLSDDYAGLTYNVKLVPMDPEAIEISIGVHRRHKDKVWRMATFVPDNPAKAWSPGFFLRGAVRFPLRQVARLRGRLIPTRFLLSTWPFRTVLRSGVWLYPAEYLEGTVPHEETGLPMPAGWQGYLKYRYGDWHRVVEDWVWHRDDHAARVARPENVVGQLQ